MDDRSALQLLAQRMGVHTTYTDGLGAVRSASDDTLAKVCRALGAPLEGPSEAGAALEQVLDSAMKVLPPAVIVAWNGNFAAPVGDPDSPATLLLESGVVVETTTKGGMIGVNSTLPFGYHMLHTTVNGEKYSSTVISAPVQAWRRAETRSAWGVGTHLAALRSARSRSVGDLRDLRTACGWVAARGGDTMTILPLLPTFNTGDVEPSPYSPVTRLFWSELILDLGDAHVATGPIDRLDVARAHLEVANALPRLPEPDLSIAGDELRRYARFRGAQARLGRDWQRWPAPARSGTLTADDVDPVTERFHLVAQLLTSAQLGTLAGELAASRFRLGLDLALGVHPDGYDMWSRPGLHALEMSVGAPPDGGFPSGQDWGFPPIIPEASRAEGHRYLARSIAHQMAVAGVLRIDHVMALTRLYWIPQGAGLHDGTYVTYPLEELLAVVTLESVRHRCEVIGENLGTVPAEFASTLPRHHIWGMYLAQFAAAGSTVVVPAATEVALIGTHDTPTLAGWLAAEDVEERVQHNLLSAGGADDVRTARRTNVVRLADGLGRDPNDAEAMLLGLLGWLGASASPLVIPWIEDLWLEVRGVNLPGTHSSARPNWQRPMARLLDDVVVDPVIAARTIVLDAARQASDARRERA
ncbi:MAG: 4-alpha-glucanotransferase [Gemmatimonadales bacterium]